MIYKFIFGDSAYKSSTLPDFARFDDVLRYKFSHTTIPSNYTLHLISPDGKICPILTQKDYEHLRNMNTDKPIRIRIVESKDRKERGRFGKPEFDELSEEISRIEEKKDDLDESADGAEVEGVFRELLEQLSEEKKQQLLQFKEIVGVNLDENKRRILDEVLAEQAPLIASKIKEAVNEEILAMQLKKVEEELQEIQKRAELLAPVKEKEKQEEAGGSIGSFFKGAFNKTGEFFDSLKQKLIGDPYVECEVGRYPKSVIEKGRILCEIFPDRDAKEVLDFINEFESSASVEALADIFAVQKQI